MKKKKKNRAGIGISIILSIVILAGVVGGLGYVAYVKILEREKPEELLAEYMGHIEKKEYEAMYAMVMPEEKGGPAKDTFIERNAKIYEGIEARDLRLKDVILGEEKDEKVAVSYHMSLETVGGEISFDNEAVFKHTEDGYRLIWNDSLIFPVLTESDKIQVNSLAAERGSILDRNGRMLAGKDTASSVGIVPGKLENKEEALQRLSELLGTDAGTIENKLSAGWVKEDSFVPVATLPKINELDLGAAVPDEAVLREQERQTQLLTIPGVMITDTEVRSYGLGAAASHLTGYVQEVTAEDLEEHPDEGYSAGDVIGRSGIEALYESELKGKEGHEVSIVDENGNMKVVLAKIEKEDGAEIRLTIDADLQQMLYEQFREDEGCSVAMNPYTGEVLALVSTPSYDSNDFIRGMSTEQWNGLNEDEKQPMYNRFRQTWCPGSSFKPVIASIGLKTGTIDPGEDFGNEGLSWQKDASWGSYHVTTLHAYEPVIMKNALIYSDNIYFAKAALKIGADTLMHSLDELKFNQEIPFDIVMSKSQYSNEGKIESEIQLADSGYGQGQILVNPLHLASIYTSFVNNGDVIKPYLRYQEDAQGEVWISQAFDPDIAAQVTEGMRGVVNDPNGTGYAAHRDDIALAGKTGTAEIKDSVEDTEGTEIGWFAVFTEDQEAEKPVLIVSMVENVKGLGGSGYVVNKDKAVLDGYLAR
ncbi:MAG: penicillin-binding transpeptidase domain-containing protein [Dorea sp.]|nr:penicillin-binding transpeptidase domain-containing protein [Dorea sp.]